MVLKWGNKFSKVKEKIKVKALSHTVKAFVKALSHTE